MSLRMRARAILSSWFPVAAWAALIFGLSGVPSLQTGLGFMDFVLRKIAHAVEFAILSLLLVRALARTWPDWPRSRWLAVAAVAAILYAMSDEFHQAFVPGRGPSIVDVMIDTGGVALALISVGRVGRWLSVPEPK